MNASAAVMNPIIYAEVSTTFQRVEDLDARLAADLFRRDELPYGAAFLAARAFVKYRRRGGSRTSPMPDFYIGAHAVASGFSVLTRDPRRIRRYFPSVEVIVP
jgi:predicted nucleic acid-binding protein